MARTVDAPESDAPWLDRAGWAALGVAAAVRVAFLGSKPFWIDEAWVATLVGEPLGRAIALRKPVPVGFVAATKLAALVPSLAPEIAFRLLPLACGLAAVVAIGRLARVLGGSRVVATTALWLAAGLPALINYSRELKPYSIDVLVAAALPLLALRVFAPSGPRGPRGPTSARRVWAILLLVLGVAPWASFGTVFPILAVLAWGTVRRWPHADRATRIAWVVAGAVYAGSFAGAYLVGLREQSTGPRLQAMWHDALFGLSGFPGPRDAAAGVFRYVCYSTTFLFPGGLWMIVLPVMAIGALAWPAPWRSLLWWMAAGTAGFTIAAALADRYPLSGRLMLFAAPPYLLCLAAGLAQIGRWLPSRPGQFFGPAIAMALAAYWSGAALAHRLDPDPPGRFMRDVLHDLEPLIARAAELTSPDDAVFASPGTGQQFIYYAHGRFPGATACHPYDCRDEPTAVQSWLGGIRERGWMLLLVDEDRPWLRLVIEGAGFERREVAAGRGTRLWEITRRTS